MARYFVYGYYGFRNFGDDLLLEAVVSNIRRHDPDAEFVIRAREPVNAWRGDGQIRFLLAESILENRQGNRLLRFLRYRHALVHEARRCDVMVVGGGTLFIDKGAINWSLLFLHEAVRAARRRGRKIVVMGVAIDILAHPLSLWLTRRIFAYADFAALRDALSLAYFQSCASSPRLTADLAWLKNVLPERESRRGERRAVGLNFIDYYRTTVNSEDGHRAYRASLQRLIERHRNEWDFHLIALQPGVGQRDDWFADEFLALVPDGKILCVEDDASLAAVLRQLDALVTTRFHMALLAAKSGLPTCIVDHELKLTSLAQDIQLPAIPLMEFVLGEMADPIERLATWDDVATRRAVMRMENRAEDNFAWIHK